MKISFFEITDLEKDKFEIAFPNAELTFFEESIQDIEISTFRNSEVLCVFVHSEVTKEIINQMPNLKLIATRSTGTDHIDLEACKEKN